MDRLTAMQTYVRVVERGSFSAAARDLRLGQPSVSRLVAQLEAAVGTRLLARSTRRVRVTEAGQAYYEAAVRALEAVDAAEGVARGLDQLSGRLRVCAPVTFARLHVVPRLRSFLEAHPDLSLDLVMDDRSIDLLREGIDVALRLGPQRDSALHARKLATVSRRLVAAPRYLEAHGRPRRPADVEAHAAVVYAQAEQEAWTFTRQGRRHTVRPPTRLTFSAAEGVREAVIAGLGLTVASEWMFAPELAQGLVVPLLQEHQLGTVDCWAVFPAGRLPTARSKAFSDFVAGLLR